MSLAGFKRPRQHEYKCTKAKPAEYPAYERNLMYHHVFHEVLLYLQEAQDSGGVLLFSASHSAAVKFNAVTMLIVTLAC